MLIRLIGGLVVIKVIALYMPENALSDPGVIHLVTHAVSFVSFVTAPGQASSIRFFAVSLTEHYSLASHPKKKKKQILYLVAIASLTQELNRTDIATLPHEMIFKATEGTGWVAVVLAGTNLFTVLWHITHDGPKMVMDPDTGKMVETGKH